MTGHQVTSWPPLRQSLAAQSRTLVQLPAAVLPASTRASTASTSRSSSGSHGGLVGTSRSTSSSVSVRSSTVPPWALRSRWGASRLISASTSSNRTGPTSAVHAPWGVRPGEQSDSGQVVAFVRLRSVLHQVRQDRAEGVGAEIRRTGHVVDPGSTLSRTTAAGAASARGRPTPAGGQDSPADSTESQSIHQRPRTKWRVGFSPGCSRPCESRPTSLKINSRRLGIGCKRGDTRRVYTMTPRPLSEAP
jgi:hypothetical protein